MEADPRVVLEYYKRAAMLATQIKRQDLPITSLPPIIPSSTPSASASASASSASVSSVSVSSQSSVSVSSVSRSSVSASSVSAASTPTSASTIASNVSSTFSSQFTTTNAAGQIVTTTLVVVPTDTSTSPPAAASNSNIGPIVGGVIGGVAVAILLALGIIYLRRKKKRDEFEANIFDPDRNVERPLSGGAGPRFDLGGTGGGAAGAAGVGVAAGDAASHVTPYSYGPTSTGPTSTHQGSSVAGQPEMQQLHPSSYYPDYGYNQNYPQYPQQSVGVGDHFPNPYGPGYQAAGAAAGAAGIGMAAGAAAGGPQRSHTAFSATTSSGYGPSSSQYDERVSSTPPPPMAGAAGSLAPQNPRSAKEREAFSRTGGNNYAVANQTDQRPLSQRSNSPSGSRVSGSGLGPTSPVVVHQDGGRLPAEDEGGNEEAEIPPTYDSIPRDVAGR